MARAAGVDVDLLSAEATADPHAAFARLRADDPIHWSDRHDAWILTRYSDVVGAFRDARLSADRIPPADAYDLLRRWMVFCDPPDHTRLRRLTQYAFTPRAIDRWRERIRAIVSDLLDDVASLGRCDLIRTFAFPLPAIVIAELLGVPPEDREKFKSWSRGIGAVVSAAEIPDRAERTRESVTEFTDYFTWLVDRSRDDPADDLLHALVSAHDEGDRLTTDELVATCTLLLFAGHETTTYLIANATRALLDNRSQLAKLRTEWGDPAVTQLAVEEFLRYDGPLKGTMRRVAMTHDRGGRTLQAGDSIYLALAAANRDPEHFADPDRLDVTRPPTPHVGFGFGIHHCLGAHLARVETQIAVPALLTRFSDLRLASDEVAYAASLISRSPLELIVEVDS